MKPANLIVILLMGAGLAVLAGCSEPGAGPPPNLVSYAAWRNDVDRYVADVGNGDPGVLADVTLPAAEHPRAGFALVGQPDRDRSTDAIGLLLGHRMVAGHPWFIYLVGMVKAGSLIDIRIEALCHDAEPFVWRQSPSNADALQRYQEFADGVPDSPQSGERFPRREDRFELAVAGSRIVITHRASGARWTLELPSNVVAPPGD